VSAAVRLVVLDVEGVITRAGGSHEPWPLEEIVALRDLIAGTPLAVVLCTGRQVPYGEAIVQALGLLRPLPASIRQRVAARGLGFAGWPSVLENGAYLYDALGRCAIALPSAHPGALEDLPRLRRDLLAPLVEETGATFEPGKDVCISINPPPVRPGAIERVPTDEFRPVVDERLRGHDSLIEVSHSKSAIDITPKGISKASGVGQLLDCLGLGPDEVLGVGDTRADAAWLSMLRWQATPSNGREALPHVAYHAPHPDVGGLIDILKRLVLRGYEGV